MNKELLKRILSSIFLIPFTFFVILNGSLIFNLFILICFFFTAYEWNKMVKNNLYSITGLIFLIFSFFSLYTIRFQFIDGQFYVLFVILVCALTDIGGFVFGKLFKGPKLTKISPNKTYAGMIGGYCLSVISILVLNNFIEQFNLDFSLTKLAILVILISTVSQLGDLLISYFKRLTKIKDTGKIIPGHGGILDRIDGMIFAFPFVYILMTMQIINLK